MDWKAFWNDSPQVRDSDFCRQVGRTFNKASYSERQLALIAERLLWHLDASLDKTLLDLACGNGLITSRLAPAFKAITGVDFSRPLIETARIHFPRKNIDYRIGDAVDLDAISDRYDRVLISGALQHFSPDQVSRVFRQLTRIVAPGGRVVLGDVADGDRRWNFYRGATGRFRYALERAGLKPIIGYWWAPSALRRIAGDAGWTLAIQYQTADFPNHYFRYDAVLIASDAPASARDSENQERSGLV